MLVFKAARITRLITQMSSYASTTSSNYAATSQLNNQILISKNWSEFFKIFKTNKQSFTLDTFHVSSRYISQLLSRQKENINYADFIQIVNVISNLDVSNMTESNILSILALVRNFCIKGLEMHTIYKLKNKLCGKCNEIIINKPVGKENISELIYVYYEMAFFGWQPGSRYVSQRIMNRINKQPENFSILTLNQSTFLLNALATKGDLVNYERKLRSYILKTLVNKLDVIKLQDLVNALVSVNKMDFYDATTQQSLFVKQLGTKMLQNITELQQKSIFEFLKGDHNNQHTIFFKIYEDLIKSTYREIQQNGNTNFDYRTVLRLISHLSSRLSFNSHTQLEKKKLYNFLKNAAQHFRNENDTQGTRQLQVNIQEILRNRYHDVTKNQEIVQILSKGNVPLRYPLLEVLYNSKININEFLQTFLQNNNLDNASIPSLIKICSFLKRVTKNPNYQSQVKNIERFLQSPTKRIEGIFQNPDVFSDNFNFFFRNSDLGINYRAFHQQYDYFSRLPNPFQLEEDETSPFYKLAYLNYVVNTFRPKDFYKFVKDYNQRISNLVIAKLVFNHVGEDSRKIEPNRFIVHLVFRNLTKAIEQNEKDFINASFQLLNKYNRFIVCNDRDFQLAKYITKIIIVFLTKIQALKAADSDKIFFPILAKYLSRNAGNYKNEQIYRDILKHSFKILDKLSNFLVIELLKQGLRLNLVDKKTLEKVNLSNLNGFNYFEKQTLAYIQDSSKVTQINNINPASLTAIFANHNLQNFIEQNQAQILKALEKVYINERVACLTLFNQPMSKVSVKMVNKILELITSNNISIQRADFQGAINNLLERGYSNVLGTRQFAQKIISLLTNKMGLFSLWTHTEAIRFAISIPTFNPKEYYNKLVQYTERYNSELDVQELLFRLAFTNYDFRTQDLKYVQTLIKRNIFRGIYLFLATENMHSEDNRKIIVSALVHKLKQGKEGQASIQKLQHEYLKRAYPQETKDLDLKPQQLQKAVYFIKPRPKITNILQKLANYHQVSLETLPDFEQNYIFKIKNLCICFLNSKRNGSFHQHEFLKRALHLYYKDQGYTFMFSGFVKVAKMPEYIEKYAPELITPEFKQQITQFLQTFREKFQEDELQQKKTEKKQQGEKERKSRKISV